MPKTPSSVLISQMKEYQLNAFSLSKAINLSNSAVLYILKGKGKITVPTALRLSKLFGQTPAYWLDLQREADLFEAAKDKELLEIVKGISKAKKPKVVQETKTPVKTSGKKKSLADKRKAAAKVPGARPAKRKVNKK
jgi:addiction module HigA family antidote